MINTRKIKADLRRWLERAGVLTPRHGRQEVWYLHDLGLLDQANREGRLPFGGPGSELPAKARPRASMSFRVYRAATGTWEGPFFADRVDVVDEKRSE